MSQIHRDLFPDYTVTVVEDGLDPSLPFGSARFFVRRKKKEKEKMKTRKSLFPALLLTAALLLSLLSGCGAQPAAETPAPAETPAEAVTDEAAVPAEAGTEPEPEDSSITVTDMMGREIVLPAPAAKIVVLTAAECEILYAIGAGDTVVGRGEYCDYPAEVFDIPSVNSGYQTNVEQILALEPDVVIMNSMDQSPEDVTKLEEAGVTVAVTVAADIQGVYESIALIGALTGKDAEAAELAGSMKSSFDAIAADPAGDGTQTVYFEVSPLQWGLWTAGKGTFMDEVATLVGLKNCFDDLEGWAEISEEQVLERNPDYIVTISMNYDDGPTPVEEILARPGWEKISAVANNAVLNLQNNELTRPGPRLADGAVMLNDFVNSFAAADAAA